MSLRGALLVFALACAAVLTGCGQDSKPRALTPAEKLTLPQLVGQRVVAGFTGTKPPQRLLIAIRQGAVGGVILFADNAPSMRKTQRMIGRLQNEARLGKQPYLLVMTDQEGGEVRRFAWAPPKQSAQEMGASSRAVDKAHSQGTLTGAALRQVGVNVDLAPVADIVPTGATGVTAPTDSGGVSAPVTAAVTAETVAINDPTSLTGGVPPIADPFLGPRSFGSSPRKVAKAACGFVSGLQNAAVAATMKHFPGLGLASANTDFAAVDVTAPTKAIKAGWRPYATCDQPPKLAMFSSAHYPSLGIKKPAVIDPHTYELLASTGFHGLTITDSFDTPAIKDYADAPLRALKAGVTFVLFGQRTSFATKAYDKLLAQAQSGAITKPELQADAARILSFKKQLRDGDWNAQ